MLSPRRFAVRSLLFVVCLMGCEDDRRRGTIDASVGRDASTDTPIALDASTSDSAALDGALAGDSGAADALDAGGPFDAAVDTSVTDVAFVDSGAAGIAPQAGDLAIVEIQGNPVRATDEQAEYIEILNVSGRVLDLSRVSITHISFVGGEPEASADRHAVGRTLLVEPGERVLFGSSDGGFFGASGPDYVYAGILISNAETETTRLRLMVPDWDGVEPPNAADVVDEVIVESRVFGYAVRGQAWQFDPARGTPTAASNDDAANWCTTAAEAALEYRGSNFGTPGAPNACE